MFLTLGRSYLLSMKTSSTLSVNKFWDRFRVITFPKYGSIFKTHSSVSLFRMNLIVFSFVPGTNSQICKMTLSPSSAFVRSKVYELSA